MKFISYFLVEDTIHPEKWVVDLTGPDVTGDDILFLINKSMSLKEPHHKGFQIFDTTTWLFFDPVSFDDFVVYDS